MEPECKDMETFRQEWDIFALGKNHFLEMIMA